MKVEWRGNRRSGMTTRDPRLSQCMGTCNVLHVCWSFVAAAILLSPVPVQAQGALSVIFEETPSNITSKTNALFRFNVMGADGADPCTKQQCSIRCKLDQSGFQDCLSRQDSFVSLRNGAHIFYVSVNASSGAFVTSEFHWTVDTIPPTAVVDGGKAFTNAVNVTVNIAFSEVCDHGGGFVCTNTSSCDLLVYGAGAVIPSTFKEIERGRVYSLVVGLPTDVPSGRADVVLAKSACADAAGNLFQRTENSSFVIRFDRTVPTVNLWTAIPNSEVTVDNQPRTIQATNKISDLIIYLDFSEPVTSTTDDLLSLLNVSSGILTVTQRKSYGNRRFGYALSNIRDVSVVTVTLAGNVVASRYGTLVPDTSNTTFLYDTERPQVQLSTTAAKTKNHLVPVVVQFTEPVFGFTSSGVTVSGGTLTSFKEVSKNTYALEVYVVDNNLVTVAVPENQSLDVAGNSNLASPILQVQYYTTPAVSVVLYSLTTATLLSTAFVSGAISVSSATLAAVGALSGHVTGSIGADPSRHLLGMACHLQIFALSDWLAVNLPIEYREVTRGLQWLIPHVDTPWQDGHASNTGIEFGSNVAPDIPTIQDVIRGRRRLLAMKDGFGPQNFRRGRMLGANTTLYGPAFGPSDYELYFLNQVSNMQALRSALNRNKYTGWQDFQRNMFWIGVVGGGFILLHLLTLLFIWWRTKTSLREALSVPRFELFVLILAIPGMCQASAFIIRGGTMMGIVVGVLLLAIPATFLVSVIILLIYGVFLGALVQYKEFRREVRRNGTLQPQKSRGLVALLAGTGFPGKWVRKSRLALTFLPRYGLLFEDRKGPPKMIIVETARKYRGGVGGVGDAAGSVDSDDDSDEVAVASVDQILGGARAAYILVDISRRITLGIVFGAYPRSDRSWSQVGIVLGFTIVQFLYLVLVKPFRQRGVQVVETVALLCEVGVFAAATALLADRHPTANHFAAGILMLAFLLVGFVAQLVNEWYALMKQILRLSTTAREPSLKEGLKMLAGGLILPFTPRSTWSRFIGRPQAPPLPQGGAAAVSFPNPAREREADAGTHERPRPTASHHGSPSARPPPDASIPPLYEPESPAFVDPRTIASAGAHDGDSGPPSGEIRAEASQRSWSQWSNKRSVEGKRSKGSSSKDGKTEELKMLRELAKASFPRRRKDDYGGAEHVGGMGTPLEISSPAASPRGREEQQRYVRRRRQFPGMMPHGSMEGNTDDSLSEATSDGDALHDAPTSLQDGGGGDPATVATSSSRSNNKGSGGHSETHSANLTLREPGAAIRPLEER